MSVEQTHDVETDHVYDGIKEFDNPMPRWWLMTFYGTIVFFFGYWFYYHTLETGASAATTYQTEVKVAQEAADKIAAQIDGPALLALAGDSAAVARGQEVFAANCVACHADKGQGLIGPNLTDPYWIHGSAPEQVFKTVTDGVLTKGMPAWKDVLGYSKSKDVTAYLLTLKGTNVAGKAAEGTDESGAPPPSL